MTTKWLDPRARSSVASALKSAINIRIYLTLFCTTHMIVYVRYVSVRTATKPAWSTVSFFHSFFFSPSHYPMQYSKLRYVCTIYSCLMKSFRFFYHVPLSLTGDAGRYLRSLIVFVILATRDKMTHPSRPGPLSSSFPGIFFLHIYVTSMIMY